jgi:hypothetical protein
MRERNRNDGQERNDPCEREAELQLSFEHVVSS